MNVVHAGLDILLDELREGGVMDIHKMVELLEDIFSASESAIHILNDLLEYEHLDAGIALVQHIQCQNKSHN